jgi:hypothetical protein
MKAVNGYESIKKVMDSHDARMENIEQAKSGLKKAGDREGI